MTVARLSVSLSLFPPFHPPTEAHRPCYGKCKSGKNQSYKTQRLCCRTRLPIRFPRSSSFKPIPNLFPQNLLASCLLTPSRTQSEKKKRNWLCPPHSALHCLPSTLSTRHCCAGQRAWLRGLSPRPIPAGVGNFPRHT